MCIRVFPLASLDEDTEFCERKRYMKIVDANMRVCKKKTLVGCTPTALQKRVSRWTCCLGFLRKSQIPDGCAYLSRRERIYPLLRLCLTAGTAVRPVMIVPQECLKLLQRSGSNLDLGMAEATKVRREG